MISSHVRLHCNVVGDVDNVNGLEGCCCFGFGEEVVKEAAVVVIIGDYGLPAAESVIGDDIDDDDDDCDGTDLFVIVFLCVFLFIIL